MSRVRFAHIPPSPPSPIAPPGIPKNLVGTIYVSTSVPVAHNISAKEQEIIFNFPGQLPKTISYDQLKTGYYLFPEITNDSPEHIKTVINNNKCRLIEKRRGASYAKVTHVGNDEANRTITTQLKTYKDGIETIDGKTLSEIPDFIPIYFPPIPGVGSKNTNKKKKKPKKKKSVNRKKKSIKKRKSSKKIKIINYF